MSMSLCFAVVEELLSGLKIGDGLTNFTSTVEALHCQLHYEVLDYAVPTIKMRFDQHG